MTSSLKITPMLQQYLEIKGQHPDAILFYRMGDFYEMFFDDAVEAARILNITLTSRSNKNDEERIPMCGVPYHSASGYLAKLIQAGKRVAICEQVEDPREAKGLVKREVVRVVTPGLVTEEQLLDDKENRYLAAVSFHKRSGWGVSFADLSTGEFLAAELADRAAALDELSRREPAELLFPAGGEEERLAAELLAIQPALCLNPQPESVFEPNEARRLLLDHFGTANLAGFGCDQMTAGVAAAGGLLSFVRETQRQDLGHIQRLTPIVLSESLAIDDSSRRNLELTRTIIGDKREGSLLSVLDQTRTPMGARLLKKNLLFPLANVQKIEERLDTVARLVEDPQRTEVLREILGSIYDLERLTSRVVMGSANARDLLSLAASLSKLPQLTELLMPAGGLLTQIAQGIDPLTDIHELLSRAIREDAPVTLRDGNLIREGFHPELDELIRITRDGKKLILELEAKERERTGIPNLKIGFNKVFGYYLEVSRGKQDQVPDHYIRKQTLVNAERYITPELKEFEHKVSSAEEKRLELEYRLFCETRETVAKASQRLLASSEAVAWIDFFVSLAQVASRNRYCRPTVHQGDEIVIMDGRHPVIERSLPPGTFVPNDIRLDQSENEVLIITGPNMAGKSTVLRQTALIVLMAQMGSFVPAASASIGVVDRIFTRVGAMDDLRRGQSTFMVEMNETANILNNDTDKSLVILDEIGRGTSTFDGLAIAWAVAEELVNKNGKGVKTLFATHYHELTELAAIHSRVKNFHIAVREWNDQIIFLHKLLPGGTSRSYGIQVAALAGVPRRVVARAKELLHTMENGEFNRQGKPRLAPPAAMRENAPQQLRLFGFAEHPVRERLREISPDTLTPLAALELLYELKKLNDS